MDDTPRARLIEDLSELAGFMVVSARGLMDEPAHYGPFRLVDAASRLVATLEKNGLSTDALSHLRDSIEEGKDDEYGNPGGIQAVSRRTCPRSGRGGVALGVVMGYA